MDRGHSHTPGVQRPWSILGIGATRTSWSTSPQLVHGTLCLPCAKSTTQRFAQLASAQDTECFTLGYRKSELVRDQMQSRRRIASRDQAVRIAEKAEPARTR
jgi:hypothetical protein